MGSIDKRSYCLVGKIPAELFEGKSSESDGITIPQEYSVESLIYPVVSNGYISFQSLADGTATWKDYMHARKLCEFSGWFKDYTQRLGKQKQEEVEYFD